MEERKVGKIIIFFAFIIIICCSRVIWFFSERYLDTTNYENRQLAMRPVLSFNSYKTFSRDYTAYFNDNIQFRNYLIKMNSAIDYYCFGQSSNDEVVIGKDNWLFYSRIDDGDPIGCYKGTNLFTEEELKSIAENCVKQRDFVVSQGKEFVIFIAPNKERIYSEFMPARYGKPAENYRALQLYDYLLNNTDLRVIYPYDELMRAKENLNETIYSKTDTHWNYLGGYVGATALLKALDVNMPDISSENIKINVSGKPYGDLARMLNLRSVLTKDDHEYTVSGFDMHDVRCIDDDLDNSRCYKSVNADSRCVYVIGDSFIEHMEGYIGSQFNNTYVRHYASYTYDDYVDCNPDIMVYECVERRVDVLGSFSIQ
ncbi:MAG: hypothetical protein K6C99_04300 [Lachnospiraceae bacterium]|nr:hypothetical protein [Lachnospiraceae bacterium]